MPKAAPGSRVLRGSAEGVGGGGSEEEQTEGGAALEAVTELDGKFEGWHLQAKQDAADAKAESAAEMIEDSFQVRGSFIFHSISRLLNRRCGSSSDLASFSWLRVAISDPHIALVGSRARLVLILFSFP